MTAENLADDHDISRERQDAFALHSHAKAVAAQDAGRFADELVPVTVGGRKGDTVVEADEGPRRDTSLEQLAKLRPAFREDGSVTAGNSSPLNDGRGRAARHPRAYAPRRRPRAAGRRPQHRRRGRAAARHGHRAGARRAQGAGARGPDAWTTSAWSSSTRRSPPSRWR